MNRSVSEVFWQAHRGGGAHEAPDNTMAAIRYAWELGGIPEADIRSAADGVIICLHDDTLARTTDAPDSVKNRSVSELTYAEIRQWDAGKKFAQAFSGEKVPSLEELFAEMQGKPERLVYLDLKQADLRQLGLLIDQYGINEQVIFTHYQLENCQTMKQIANGVKSMLWIGGKAESIKQKFNHVRDSGFAGLDQVQLHLNPLKEQSGSDWPYELEAEFLFKALADTKAAGIDLEVFIVTLSEKAIQQLLEIGIRWYATDEPSKFLKALQSNLI